MNHLSGLRRHESKLAGHRIDPAGLSKFCLGKAQLPILFAQLAERLLLLLQVIAALNCIEVLQPVKHHEREQKKGGGGEQAHLARAHWVRRLLQPGIVDVMDEEELRRANAATASGLLCQQFGIALGNTRLPVKTGLKISCCACRHRSPPINLQLSAISLQFLLAQSKSNCSPPNLGSVGLAESR